MNNYTTSFKKGLALAEEADAISLSVEKVLEDLVSQVNRDNFKFKVSKSGNCLYTLEAFNPKDPEASVLICKVRLASEGFPITLGWLTSSVSCEYLEDFITYLCEMLSDVRMGQIFNRIMAGSEQ